jgi:ACS family tartrate transporter-like MFS transporter
MFALFNIAVPLSSVIGAPVSGLLIEHMNGIAGLSGWQWMFLVEGVPALVMGVVVFLCLPERPETASFLSGPERSWLAAKLDAERRGQTAREHFTVGRALRDPRVLLMCLIAVGLVMGTTGIAIWMPQFVKSFGLDTVQTGFVTAIPSAFMAVAMVVVGRHADRTGERVWHAAGPFLVSGAGFTLAALSGSPLVSLIGLTIGAAGIGGASPNIWIFPATLLTGTAAAAGIALINSVGSTGGFFGPSIIGWVRDATGGFEGALLFLAAAMVVTAAAILVLGHSMREMMRAASSNPSQAAEARS